MKKSSKYNMSTWDTWETANSWWNPESIHSKNDSDIVQLYSLQRAISNFVRITTGKVIPVEFTTGKDSYTNGQRVVISGAVGTNDLDSVVGLALHEGSHCAITDFAVLHELSSVNGFSELVSIACNKNIDYYDVKGYVKDLLNIIEDRRIDMYQFRQAPGYKNYYHALYDKYFNSVTIDTALKTNAKTDGTIEDYLFHLCNMTNPNRNLKALPGLQNIYNKINIANIDRLNNTREVAELAISVLSDIITHIDPITNTTRKNNSEENSTNDTDRINASGDGENTDDNSNDNSNEGSSNNGDSNDDWDDDTDVPDTKLTDKQMRQLEKDIQKQKEFVNGDIKKKKVSKVVNDMIYSLQDSNAEIAESTYLGEKIPVVVFNHIPLNKILSSVGRIGGNIFSPKLVGPSEESIADAYNKGTVLGRKLQIRNEEKTLISTRQKSGKIDGRMLAEAGFKNANIFKSIISENYLPARVHISIDASGSMGSGRGSKWDKSNLCAVMMVRAFSMLKGIHVTVDYRTTYESSPLVAIVYDSKKETPMIFAKKVAHATSTASTPEGLCFDAIQSYIGAGSDKCKSYFINISDGLPQCGVKTLSKRNISYGGEPAIAHTAKSVNRLRDRDVNVLSYYVERGGSDVSEPAPQFKRMYGQAAKALNVDSIGSIARDITNLLMLDKVVA